MTPKPPRKSEISELHWNLFLPSATAATAVAESKVNVFTGVCQVILSTGEGGSWDRSHGRGYPTDIPYLSLVHTLPPVQYTSYWNVVL